jgi:hypothetical protein
LRAAAPAQTIAGAAGNLAVHRGGDEVERVAFYGVGVAGRLSGAGADAVGLPLLDGFAALLDGAQLEVFA